jgi:hypothetical protein
MTQNVYKKIKEKEKLIIMNSNYFCFYLYTTSDACQIQRRTGKLNVFIQRNDDDEIAFSRFSRFDDILKNGCTVPVGEFVLPWRQTLKIRKIRLLLI